MAHWMHLYQPDVRNCIGEWNKLIQRKLTDTRSLPPLSLKNMTGAYAVLLLGSGASLLLFFGEILVNHRIKQRAKTVLTMKQER